ncbi:hypothetical protein ACFQZI_00020 [Mucilaginibacter lutimaris]|uniref:Uncharacterized protein n=1 Tax=Mucilaginibacter lutimaris TaxID=931629 RepID=A0ABW2Z8S4_9SPHI
MKKIIFALLFFVPFGASAQWTTAGSNIYNSNTGNVGIGTTAPGNMLQIGTPSVGITFYNGGGTAGTAQLTNFQTNGAAMIGTAVGDGTNNYRINMFADNINSLTGLAVTGSSGNPGFVIRNTAAEYLRVLGNGNVGIGTSSPNARVDLFAPTEQLRLSYNSSNYASFLASSNGGLTVSSTGGGNITVTPSGGVFAVSGGLITYGINSTLYIPSTYTAVSTGYSIYQYASSATNFLRTAFYGNGAAPLTTNANYSGTIFASTTVNTPASGTNAWLSNVLVKPVGTVTSGGAAVTNTASLYIDGASSAGTNNYALYSPSGNNYFGGSVGIGATITNSTDKLAVNGTIHAKEVKVDLTGWPDFVFGSNYTLPSLKGLKKFIVLNHHLPEVPSEKEVIESGVNLGQMNKILLQKVEELTLYMIAKDEQLNRQQAEMDFLKNQVGELLKASKKAYIKTSMSTKSKK